MSEHKFTVLLLLLFTVVLSTASAQAERLQIVASYSILADVVANVAGEAADVTSVTPRGADSHSFQPTPGDLTTLADADVVFINGAFLEEGLLEAIENAGSEMNIVTVSSCVPMIALGEHAHEDGEEGEEHSDEAGAIAVLCEQHYAEMEAIHEADPDHVADETHEQEEEHAHAEIEPLGPLYIVDCGAGHEGEESQEAGEKHSHGPCDPHVWMEPHNVMFWTMMIRDTLIDMDPANAETYRSNAAAYLEELDVLAHDFVIPMLETVPQEKRVLITNHDFLGYFAAAYDFELVGVIVPGGSTLAEPSAADIAALIDLIRAENVTAIFAETSVSPDLAQQIADETGAQVSLLYSESLSEADGPASTYLDYMRYNLTTIAEALGGGLQ